MSESVDRRDFLKKAASVGASLGVANSALAAARGGRSAAGRVLGANDKINVGVIGVGGRGSYVGRAFSEYSKKNGDCLHIVAVCDVYEKRKKRAQEFFQKEGYTTDAYLDYNEVIGRKDIDAVIVATPDHWHAKIALAAMDSGKAD